MFARHPDGRNDLIKRLLFAGCLTGKRLLETFGSDLCNRIIWEEASHEIAGHSSGVFKADIEHIRSAIAAHSPEVIICFGKIAGDAVRSLELSIPIFYAPHPAARDNITLTALRNAANKLRKFYDAKL